MWSLGKAHAPRKEGSRAEGTGSRAQRKRSNCFLVQKDPGLGLFWQGSDMKGTRANKSSQGQWSLIAKTWEQGKKYSKVTGVFGVSVRERKTAGSQDKGWGWGREFCSL